MNDSQVLDTKMKSLGHVFYICQKSTGIFEVIEYNSINGTDDFNRKILFSSEDRNKAFDYWLKLKPTLAN